MTHVVVVIVPQDPADVALDRLVTGRTGSQGPSTVGIRVSQPAVSALQSFGVGRTNTCECNDWQSRAR
jgi:hypothetical protein